MLGAHLSLGPHSGQASMGATDLLWKPRGCYGEKMHSNKWASTQTNAWYQKKPLLGFDYIPSGLGDTRHSFKLTDLLPSSSWACAESSPIHSVLFAWPRDLPCTVAILAPMAQVSEFCCNIWFYCTGASPVPSWLLLSMCLAEKMLLLFLFLL